MRKIGLFAQKFLIFAVIEITKFCKIFNYGKMFELTLQNNFQSIFF